MVRERDELADKLEAAEAKVISGQDEIDRQELNKPVGANQKQELSAPPKG